ncbi:MAG: glycosyltransferase family 4 protein [Patescibacteria group bacterium]
MKLLYATSFEKTSGLANRFQVLAMARSFGKVLDKNFILGAASFEDKKDDILIHNFKTTKSSILAWRVLKFVRKNNIKVVYSREQNLLFFLVIFNALFFRLPVKVVYEVHTIQKTLRGNILDWFLGRFIFLHVFLTDHLKQAYVRKYKLSETSKIVVAHDGVDISTFDVNISKQEAREKYNLPQDKKIIGYFGRFKTMGMDKGISDILKALKNLPTNIVFLAMGGKKRDREEYEIQAQNLGVRDRVIFVEQFEQHILAEYQKAVDIFLMPFPDTEHFRYYMSPLKMFEYMAAKRPIVTTNLPSIREVLNETTAMIVPPGNPAKLEQAINYLLDNPKIGEELSRLSFLKVSQYTWEERCRIILEVI